MTVDTKHLRELLEKATPGPWETWVCMPIGKSEDWRPHQLGPPNGADSDAFAECDEEPDAQLIAALRNSAEELLDAAEWRQKDLDVIAGAKLVVADLKEAEAELERYKRALAVAEHWVYKLAAAADFPQTEMLEPYEYEKQRILAGGDE